MPDDRVGAGIDHGAGPAAQIAPRFPSQRLRRLTRVYRLHSFRPAVEGNYQ
jgi:hypothetical protein